MNILHYLYNNLIVILYSGTCLLEFSNYLKKPNKKAVYLSVLFFCLLLNQLIISMTEFIPRFSRIYDAFYLNMPVFSTVVFLLTALCLLNLFLLMKPDKKAAGTESVILSVLCLLLLLIPTLKNSLTNRFFYTAVYLLYLLYRGVLFYFYLHKKSLVQPHGSYCRVSNIFSYLFILFPILGLIESFIEIFYFNSKTNPISHRLISLDFLFGISAVFRICTYLHKEAASLTCEAATDSFKIYAFCNTYALTKREQTILTELLRQKTHQQISDKLLISSFTVKTHVHNICQKTAVKSKHELCALYENYKENSFSEE